MRGYIFLTKSLIQKSCEKTNCDQQNISDKKMYLEKKLYFRKKIYQKNKLCERKICEMNFV